MTLYCTCDHPLIDVDHDAGCRRCGLPVDFTPTPACVVCGDRGCEFCPKVRGGSSSCLGCLEGHGLHAIDCPRRVEPVTNERMAELEQAAGFADDELRRQDLVDRLSSSSSPVWDEAGEVRVIVAVLLVLVVVCVFAWHYLVGAGVIFAAWRVVTRHTRGRRPRSSWSSLGRTAALMFAAWNSRWLKPSTVARNGERLRVSVPASVGREHVDDEGVPF